MPEYFLPILLVVIILVILVSTIRIVPKHKRLSVFRLGRKIGERGPGFVLVLPIIDRALLIDAPDPMTRQAQRETATDVFAPGQPGEATVRADMTETELLHRLMAAVNFTSEDLARNRMGQVSDRQVRSLTRRAWAAAAFPALLGLAFGTGMLAVGLTGNEPPRSIVFSGAGIMITILMLFLFSVAGWLLWTNLAEVKTLRTVGADGQRKVKSVEGQGRRSYIGGRITSWYCHVGDKSFSISGPAYRVFIDGEFYRAYYTAWKEHLLSIELVRSETI